MQIYTNFFNFFEQFQILIILGRIKTATLGAVSAVPLAIFLNAQNAKKFMQNLSYSNTEMTNNKNLFNQSSKLPSFSRVLSLCHAVPTFLMLKNYFLKVKKSCLQLIKPVI